MKDDGLDKMKLANVLTFILLQYFNDDTVFGTKVSEEKCNFYRNMLPKISEVFPETDEEAVLTEFPFMAHIGNQSLNGILISENFVLTVASRDLTSAKNVMLGYVGTEDIAHTKYFDVIEEVVHPHYKIDSTFDLKLLRLNGSVQFDEYIRPACLPQPKTRISNELLEVGWSKTNLRSNKQLHKVKLKYISDSECKDQFKNIAHQQQLMKKIHYEKIFCATTKEGDRDMCLGFFGAALLNKDRKSFSSSEIIGIATTNTGCNDTYPTVFVRISESLDWIERIVWPLDVIVTETTSKVDLTTHPSTTNLHTNVLEIKKILIWVIIGIAITFVVFMLCSIVAYFTGNVTRNRQEVIYLST